MSREMFDPRMQNLDSPGVVPYEAAVPLPKRSIFELLFTFIVDLINLIRVLILSFPLMLLMLRDYVVARPQKNITGQLALVTGGGNGLGKAIALRLAKQGVNVAIADVDITAAERVAGDIRSFGVKSKAYKCDVSDFADVKQLRNDIEEDLGPVDILVNNAALIPAVSLMEGKPDDIERILKVNVTSNFWTVRIFLPSMIRRRKGHIVAVSSMAGILGLGRAAAYSSSKFAVRGFMEALREEIRMDNLDDQIYTTTFYPYFVLTRRDFVEVMKKSDMFKRHPPVLAEDAADALVDGILENQAAVAYPKIYGQQAIFLSILPQQFQDLIKRIMVKEYVPKIEIR